MKADDYLRYQYQAVPQGSIPTEAGWQDTEPALGTDEVLWTRLHESENARLMGEWHTEVLCP